MMASDRFYADLTAFEDFDLIADPGRFTSVPDDWVVVVTDIRNSTGAIADGRYKEVNLVGASCITAALNAVSPIVDDGDIAANVLPFVFGGDGATILCPGSVLPLVRDALVGVAVLTRGEFGFDLRIGAVPVKALREKGADVAVAKLRLSPGNDIAMIGGGGAKLADRLIKSTTATEDGYRISVPDDAPPADLSGLSCRWEPLKAQNGVTFCIMVQALAPDIQTRQKVFGDLLREISAILGGDVRKASPVSPGAMIFKWIPKGLRMEARLTRAGQPFWRRWLYLLYQSFIQYLLERFDLSAGGYDAPSYRAELRANSDFRRYDDVLRLVLDCRKDQAAAIEARLKELRETRAVAYGLHAADHALMTCLLFNLEQGEHIHFVDGGMGGFTLAAVEFKRQLKEA